MLYKDENCSEYELWLLWDIYFDFAADVHHYIRHISFWNFLIIFNVKETIIEEYFTFLPEFDFIDTYVEIFYLSAVVISLKMDAKWKMIQNGFFKQASQLIYYWIYIFHSTFSSSMYYIYLKSPFFSSTTIWSWSLKFPDCLCFHSFLVCLLCHNLAYYFTKSPWPYMNTYIPFFCLLFQCLALFSPTTFPKDLPFFITEKSLVFKTSFFWYELNFSKNNCSAHHYHLNTWNHPWLLFLFKHKHIFLILLHRQDTCNSSIFWMDPVYLINFQNQQGS